MKMSKVGIVAVAMLLVVAGTGFGIAQAGPTHSERPTMWVEEGLGNSFDYQQSPMETGSLPDESIPAVWVEEGLGASFDFQLRRGE